VEESSVGIAVGWVDLIWMVCLTMTGIMALSLFLVSFSLFLYIIFKIIPSKAETYLLATYPEYKLEKL
jgi:hypothetical protein